LDTEFITWGTRDLLRVPRELLADTGLQTLVASMQWLELEFVNMPVWCAQNSVEDSQGLVVYAEDETLYVHNSYTGASTPVDYLRAFLAQDIVPDKISASVLSSAPAYWMGGQQVVKHEGYYYDILSGKRIKS